MLTLILGGARSGKSRFAQNLALHSDRIAYIATCSSSGDPEMSARIARHRAARPDSWETVEAPLNLAAAIEAASKSKGTILVDCLTLWLSNLFEHHDPDVALIESVARAQLQSIAAASKHIHVILVSNELGSGTVPGASLTRAFRDAHGLLNQFAAELADQVVLIVAGLPLYLKTAPRERRTS